jgi:NAD(P)-dependent dehydrogenase (short-subunit alcohol dehydrogenase family)
MADVASTEAPVAVVTGAGGGIGSAVVRRLALDGYAIVANDHGVTVDGQCPSNTAADSAVRKVLDAGGRAVANYSTVADFDGAKELIRSAVDQFGRLDLLVTCHGVVRERMIFNMSEHDWRTVASVHLDGTFNCLRFATAQMRLQMSGSIVTFTSAAGLEGSVSQANYSAAKSGIVGLTYSAALAMGRYGVNVNCIAPVAATRMTTRLNERTSRTQPDCERGDATVIADLTAALADPVARHITGQVYTASSRRVARWSHPHEVERLGISAEMVDDAGRVAGLRAALVGRLGNEPLRRFRALDLPLPHWHGDRG